MRLIKSEEIKPLLLDILLHIDSFCKKHGIRYYLSGGTALGAVRHHGFIPWDDDIDIMMFRDDYERFLTLYKDSDQGEYTLHSFGDNKRYLFPYAKIDNSQTLLIEDLNQPSPFGINIDIFPIDNLPDSIERQKHIYHKAGFLKAVLSLKQIKINKSRKPAKNILLACGRFLLLPFSTYSIVKSLATLHRSFPCPESSYCGVVVWGYGMSEVNEKKVFSGVLLTSFEGHQFPIPVGYDTYLHSLYGNYMELPPLEKRKTHHSSVAYWK